jgi:hypothetical protein
MLPNPTEANTTPIAINPAVRTRSARGESHDRVASQARIPVAPAAAVVAPSMHCAHMIEV